MCAEIAAGALEDVLPEWVSLPQPSTDISRPEAIDRHCSQRRGPLEAGLEGSENVFVIQACPTQKYDRFDRAPRTAVHEVYSILAGPI